MGGFAPARDLPGPPLSMRIGIDIGGTFTDIVCVTPDGTLLVRKVPSTPDDYSRSVLESLPGLFAEAGSGPGQVQEVIHGTTVATNALLQGSGARTALITTQGFRDVLELRRIRMPELYNWDWDKPPDLVPRRLRREVRERVDAQGRVIHPIDSRQAEQVIEEIAAAGIESLAVCLINSYANPEHEERLADLVRQRLPELPLSLSSRILREVREYERTATTVVNAYVLPIVQRYVRSLLDAFARLGMGAPLLIMQSNGGVMTAEACRQQPVYIIESGPAAGVIASQELARRMDLDNVITFDMGGTTAKASIIEEGALQIAAEYEVGSSLSSVSRLIKGGGHLIRIPAIDVAEVGAGGGSIAWLDAGGALNIGPRSAGASPGPVCYDQGGTEATITDANLLLGYINPEGLVGGGLPLNRRKAEQALAEQVAEPLGLDLIEAAYGVHLLANSTMIRAVRAVSTERGRDLREAVLFAFGGSGPIHACGMAGSLEMSRAVVPQHPGLFSAFGLLSADIEHHRVQTCYQDSRTADLERLNRLMERMESEVRQLLEEEGFARDEIRILRKADLRYSGQSFELSLPVPDGPLDAGAIRRLEQAFDEEHQKTYGHRAREGEAYTLVNLRLIGRVAQRRSLLGDGEPAAAPRAARSSRRAHFGPGQGWMECPLPARTDLRNPRQGPLLIDEFDTTIVVPPGWQARCDGSGNLSLRLADPSGEGRRPGKVLP